MNTQRLGIKNKLGYPKRMFWIANSLGWLTMGCVNVLFQTSFFNDNFEAFIYTPLVISTGFLASLLLRYLILKLQILEKKVLLLGPMVFLLMVFIGFITSIVFSWLIITVMPSQNFEWSMFFYNWFEVALIFSVWTSIYLAYMLNEKRLKLIQQKFDLSIQLKEAELNNLRKQLSPHFLFNAINNIRSLVLVDPEMARQSLLDVSDLLRYALNYQKKTLVSIAEEMEVVSAYVNLNMIHLQGNADFRTHVDEELEGLMIPPMSIQLLIENAVKHGELMNNAQVSVSVVSEKNENRIEVVNPGKLKEGYQEGIGLSNLKQRLKAQFGSNVSFQLIEVDGIIKAQIQLFK